MNYSETDAGRVDQQGSTCGSVCFWTFGDVEERLVEAMQFWWRVKDGSWPFAGDGPWHLIERDQADVNTDVFNGRPIAPALRPVPLSVDDIGRRDEATAWLAMIPERDRKLVQVAIAFLAAGRAQVPWTKVRRRLGSEADTRCLGMRYSRAITRVAKALTAQGVALSR